MAAASASPRSGSAGHQAARLPGRKATAMRLSLLLCLAMIAPPAAAQARPARRVDPPTLEERVLAAVFDALRSFGTPLPGTSPPFCVRFNDRSFARAPDLSRLPVGKGPVLGRTECPQTYASWIRVVDSTGRDITPSPPPGHIDPYTVEIWRPVLLAPGIMVVRMLVSRSESWLIHCEVSVPDTRNATCGTIHHLIH